MAEKKVLIIEDDADQRIHLGIRVSNGAAAGDLRAHAPIGQHHAELCAEYVSGLEQQQDAAELPEASGEAIAAEFERYLRRRQGN